MADFEIKRLHTIVVPVKDLERSISFYKDVLNLTEEFVENGMASYSVGSGEKKITLLLHIIDQPEPVEKGIVIEFEVDDVNKTVTSIREAGGQIIQEPVEREWGVKEAVIADPDGYNIWMVEPLS
ncbi:VOC family protein [Virgibacillus senegalensis]|uniref:VOC family protein n=1 Tax=Virgibacillus senegalensis TaxID=1499679 RepID=UPI00069F3964|nr:VOC family protein [Virgibacillus senegalensis]